MMAANVSADYFYDLSGYDGYDLCSDSQLHSIQVQLHGLPGLVLAKPAGTRARLSHESLSLVSCSPNTYLRNVLRKGFGDRLERTFLTKPGRSAFCSELPPGSNFTHIDA